MNKRESETESGVIDRNLAQRWFEHYLRVAQTTEHNHREARGAIAALSFLMRGEEPPEPAVPQSADSNGRVR